MSFLWGIEGLKKIQFFSRKDAKKTNDRFVKILGDLASWHFSSLLTSIQNRIRLYTLRIRHATLGEWLTRGARTAQNFRIRLFPLLHVEDRVKSLSSSHLENLDLPDCVAYGKEGEIETIMSGKEFALGNGNLNKRDIRAQWEPARLQHVAVLTNALLQKETTARAARVGGFAKKTVQDWIDANPFPHGAHYLSAMECAIRIPVFFSCIKTAPLGQDEVYKILTAIYQHAWLISKRLSLYSSLGNHTIAEGVGLIFAGAIFQQFSEGKSWLKKGIQLLEQESTHQILDDGGPCEQSFSYHRFVLDLYWLATNFLEKNRIRDCNRLKPRLLRGEQFLAAFGDDSGSLPGIGDSDDGYAVAPGVFPRRPTINRKPKQLEIFEQTGYSVINSPKGVKLTFDYGPLGMAPLYNHGHADALSITLSKNGKGLLVDPGTYRYNGVPEFRRYFKGTRAHNTVTIDGLDQAVQETGFIWSRPYESVLEKSEEKDGEVVIQASHNGYSALKEPVLHKRTVLYFDKTGFVVKDAFSGEGLHSFELNFHLHPNAVCNEEDGWLVIDNQGERIFLKLLGNHSFKFYSGEENPPFGWYSPAYGVKMKSSVLSCLIEGAPEDVSFMTAIGTEAPLEIESI